MARHRKPSKTKQNLARAATVTTGGVAVLAISATTSPASAAPDSAWAPLIECESGGNPTAQNPNSSASGLYQIIDGTWAAYGGLAFAPRAKDATPEQQRIVAEAVLAGQGPGAWGACGVSLEGATAAPAPVVPETAPAFDGNRVVEEARKYLGQNYVWGGESLEEGGFDCSGLVFRAYANLGIDVPRTSGALAAHGSAIASLDQAQPGDILAWPGHVAIYSGNGMMVEASTPGTQVHERAVWGSPTIRRVIATPTPAPVVQEPVGNEYTVQSGDTLTEIAAVTGTNWKEVYNNNRAVIGDNPNLIFPQQVLFVGGLLLPTAPATVHETEVVGDFANPLPNGKFASDFGPRPEMGDYHAGIDIAAPIGTPFFAAGAGTVNFAGLRDPDGFGAVVYMTLDDGTELWYGHIQEWTVNAGDRVVAGQQLGTVGNRGFSTGPHLHFQVGGALPVNAETWLNDRGIFVR